jgi:hypothetical protein
MSNLNEDMLATRCGRLLRQLLHVEKDAAQGNNYSAQKVLTSESGNEDERNVLFITLPYFGTIRFTRNGIRSTETAKASSFHTQEPREHVTLGGIGSVQVSNQVLATDFGHRSGNSPERLVDNVDPGNLSSQSLQSLAQLPAEEIYTVSDASRLPGAIVRDGIMQQQDIYPGVASDKADWVFQGFDTTFFDNLIGEEGVWAGDLGRL